MIEKSIKYCSSDRTKINYQVYSYFSIDASDIEDSINFKPITLLINWLNFFVKRHSCIVFLSHYKFIFYRTKCSRDKNRELTQILFLRFLLEIIFSCTNPNEYRFCFILSRSQTYIKKNHLTHTYDTRLKHTHS